MASTTRYLECSLYTYGMHGVVGMKVLLVLITIWVYIMRSRVLHVVDIDRVWVFELKSLIPTIFHARTFITKGHFTHKIEGP